MPNPHCGNEKAAAFVHYYASPSMVNSSVNRLYYGGLERKKRAEARAMEEAYPPTLSVRRSPAQLEAYLNNCVQGELLRRQQHRAALQQELYPDAEETPRFLSKKEMTHHIHHMYDEPLKVRRAREAELRRIFGTNKDAERVKKETVYQYHRLPASSARAVTGSSPRSASSTCGGNRGNVDVDTVANYCKQLEKGWRPPSVSVEHADNRRLLVSQYDYYADPRKHTELMLRPRPLTAKERTALQSRLELLARPSRVNAPVVPSEEQGGPPPFRVSRKIFYND
ncbi:conserved hypothetical protein [Leishmania mexicana MHOM/GT/2001/U1103]|uniref:Uncharacterized protein n=1 Tax=Leishmania mexicana (strain MHOM/GT/2001/U1103) TaxID=929439 RepID=E9AYL2_LEIMU|nr:conserved hypothetical protein [Leishmania mexicana MHOM/GT/2001/U1103]CBZ28054.1 conserved hypothetical protein [Leishmania mexicana MHOM/GT/2001/U1103]